MPSNQEILEERKRRIRSAVALEDVDRVPVVPLGDSFAAKVVGQKLSDFCTNLKAYETMIKAFTGLGEIDGIQHATYNVNILSLVWLSRLEIPGRDLPDDNLWQVKESELMVPSDYDKIINEGYQKFLSDFYVEKLDNLMAKLGPWLSTFPEAIKAWEDLGIVVLSPVVTTIPYEYFCGGRSLREFVKDLYRTPDKVQAAMDAAMPDLLEGARQVCRQLKLFAVWVGGWRAASEFLSRPLWERFVFPYYLQLVEAVVSEGVTPVLHFDSDWTRDLEYFRQFPKAKCVLSLDGSTDIYRAKEVLGDHMCIMGDVPPGMLTLATPEVVYEYCRKLIRDIGPTGFILAQGCDTPPNAKPENVKAMLAAVRG